MRKIALMGWTLLGLGAVLLMSFHWIGSSLDEDGQLVEPFGLLPLGYLAAGLGLFLLWLDWRRGTRPDQRKD